MQKLYKYIISFIIIGILIISIIIFTILTANSRVAFSRPGNMIRIPNVDNSMYKSLFALDVSSEILSSTQNPNKHTIVAISRAKNCEQMMSSVQKDSEIGYPQFPYSTIKKKVFY